MWLLKRRKFDGQVIGAFLFIYGVARFFLEPRHSLLGCPVSEARQRSSC